MSVSSSLSLTVSRKRWRRRRLPVFSCDTFDGLGLELVVAVFRIDDAADTHLGR